MQVRFWGVRGSIAVSGGAFHRTGGHTSCVELLHDGRRLVLDGGTGLAALGQAIVAEGAPSDTTIVFTHVHWDHIQGVPFFAPAFRPGDRVQYVGAPGLRAALEAQMRAPAFPVGMDAFHAHVEVTEVQPDSALRLGPFTAWAREQSHPNGVCAYRIEAGGHTVVFATDVEHGTTVDPGLVELSDAADLLIHDAQYTPEEYPAHAGWGHSTWDQAVAVADAARVRQLALFHHDPTRDDDAVAVIEAQAARRRPGTIAAREGARVEL